MQVKVFLLYLLYPFPNQAISNCVSAYFPQTAVMLYFRFLTLALQKLILELTWQLVPDRSLIQVIPSTILKPNYSYDL